MVKGCTRCLNTKPFEAFAKNSRSKDGKQDWCRACFKAYNARPTLRRSVRRRALSLPILARDEEFLGRVAELMPSGSDISTGLIGDVIRALAETLEELPQ